MHKPRECKWRNWPPVIGCGRCRLRVLSGDPVDQWRSWAEIIFHRLARMHQTNVRGRTHTPVQASYSGATRKYKRAMSQILICITAGRTTNYRHGIAELPRSWKPD